MANLGLRGRDLDDVSYDQVKENLMAREKKASIPSLIVDMRYDNF